MLTVTNILVAIDFSETSEAALNYARELARTVGARLHVLHVVEHAFMWTGSEAVGIDFGRLQSDLESSARSMINRLLTANDRDQLKAVTIVCSCHSPAFAIAEYARAKDIDLLVVGTHGRGTLGHLLRGNVAEKVARHAPCPVLTVHHPEQEFRPGGLAAVGTAADSDRKRRIRSQPVEG